MQITKKKFVFKSRWNGKDALKHEGGGKNGYSGVSEAEENNDTFVANSNASFCKVGFELSKWLGSKRKRVIITITKGGTK